MDNHITAILIFDFGHQISSHHDMNHAIQKLKSCGSDDVIFC